MPYSLPKVVAPLELLLWNDTSHRSRLFSVQHRKGQSIAAVTSMFVSNARIVLLGEQDQIAIFHGTDKEAQQQFLWLQSTVVTMVQMISKDFECIEKILTSLFDANFRFFAILQPKFKAPTISPVVLKIWQLTLNILPSLATRVVPFSTSNLAFEWATKLESHFFVLQEHRFSKKSLMFWKGDAKNGFRICVRDGNLLCVAESDSESQIIESFQMLGEIFGHLVPQVSASKDLMKAVRAEIGGVFGSCSRHCIGTPNRVLAPESGCVTSIESLDGLASAEIRLDILTVILAALYATPGVDDSAFHAAREDLFRFLRLGDAELEIFWRTFSPSEIEMEERKASENEVDEKSDKTDENSWMITPAATAAFACDVVEGIALPCEPLSVENISDLPISENTETPDTEYDENVAAWRREMAAELGVSEATPIPRFAQPAPAPVPAPVPATTEAASPKPVVEGRPEDELFRVGDSRRILWLQALVRLNSSDSGLKEMSFTEVCRYLASRQSIDARFQVALRTVASQLNLKWEKLSALQNMCCSVVYTHPLTSHSLDLISNGSVDSAPPTLSATSILKSVVAASVVAASAGAAQTLTDIRKAHPAGLVYSAVGIAKSVSQTANATARYCINQNADAADLSLRPLGDGSPALTALICIGGWLAESENPTDDWMKIPSCNSQVFVVGWEKQCQVELGKQLIETQKILDAARGKLSMMSTISVARSLNASDLAVKVITSPYSLARARGKKAGVQLAQMLLEQPIGARPISLIGYGPGADLVFSCLKEIARYGSRGMIMDIFLIGGGHSSNVATWERIRPVVAGRLVNVYIPADSLHITLHTSQKVGNVEKMPAGLRPIALPTVENQIGTEFASNLTGYKTALMPLCARLNVWN